MIVRLTRQQYEWFSKRVQDDEFCDVALEFKRWLNELHRPQEASQLRVDVTLPFIGWVVAANRLFNLVYKPNGARAGARAGQMHERCLRTIINSIHWYHNHPAFKAAGVFSPSTEIYPAWLSRFRDTILASPCPKEGWPMCAMVPQRLDEMNGRPTVWVATRLDELQPEGPLWVSEHHSAFDRSSLRDGELTPVSIRSDDQ